MKRLSILAAMLALVLTAACGSTDGGITTAVKSKMAADDAVKAYQVDVDTREGIVTLNGTVGSNAARTRAVMLARETDGVTDVVDNLRVDDAVATSGIDDDIDDAGNAAERGIREGADDAADATRRAGESVRDSNVDERAEDAARDGGDAVADGAKKVGNAAKKGAGAVADGAKNVGSEIKDVFTDDKPDPDGDGK